MNFSTVNSEKLPRWWICTCFQLHYLQPAEKHQRKNWCFKLRFSDVNHYILNFRTKKNSEAPKNHQKSSNITKNHQKSQKIGKIKPHLKTNHQKSWPIFQDKKTHLPQWGRSSDGKFPLDVAVKALDGGLALVEYLRGKRLRRSFFDPLGFHGLMINMVSCGCFSCLINQLVTNYWVTNWITN